MTASKLEQKELKEIALDAVDNLKGQDVVCLDVQQLTSICDFMIVVTGTSSRHVQSLADEVSKKIKEAGGKVFGMEGKNQSEWVLIDLGDIIVHIMLGETRKLYDLESLWGLTPQSQS